MVQFFETAPDTTRMHQNNLAKELGHGLGNFIGAYSANKSLDLITNDPTFKDKPLSEKIEKIQSGLRGYGEHGLKALTNRLQIEQEVQKEKQQKSLSRILEKTGKGQELNEKDLEDLHPSQQFEILKQQNKIKENKFQEDQKREQHKEKIEMADRMADNAGLPELKGQNFTPDIMGQLIRDSRAKNKPQKADKPTALETYIGKKNFDEYQAARKAEPIYRDSLNTIDELEKQANENLSGISGYSKALFNTQSAADFNATAMLLLKEPLKEFNPRGAIPTQKINLLLNRYVPKASDNLSTIQGKLDAQRKIISKIRERNQEFIDLYERNNGNLSDPLIKSFDKTNEAIIDQYNQEAKQNNKTESKKESQTVFSELPSPEKHVNQRIEDDQTGAIYESNGEEWIRVQ